MEYEIDECTAGSDTLCGSCEVCEWSTAQMETGCRGSPYWWKLSNCWFDKDGNTISRNMVDLEDLRIDSRQSRRHWVWDENIPKVSGYFQGSWTPDEG